MRLLLDTHCWLWLQVSPQKISPQGLDLLENPKNTLFLSAASAWEIAIKYALDRLPLPAIPAEYVPRALQRHGVQELPVEMRHSLRVASLPHHHGDPFDRILIAQAKLEGMTLLTADRQLEAYDVDLIRV